MKEFFATYITAQPYLDVSPEHQGNIRNEVYKWEIEGEHKLGIGQVNFILKLYILSHAMNIKYIAQLN